MINQVEAFRFVANVLRTEAASLPLGEQAARKEAYLVSARRLDELASEDNYPAEPEDWRHGEPAGDER